MSDSIKYYYRSTHGPGLGCTDPHKTVYSRSDKIGIYV